MLQTRDTHEAFETLATDYLERHPQIPHTWSTKKDISGGRRDLICWPETDLEVFASLRRGQITIGSPSMATDFEELGRGLSDAELAQEAFDHFLELVHRSLEQDRPIEEYQEALRADPSDHTARHRLAARLVRMSRTREALHEATHLRLVGELAPELAFNLGRALAEGQRDHARGLPWFEAAEAMEHHHAPICRAHCLLNLGQTREAFDLYEIISRDTSVHPSVSLDSRLGMAKATFDLGDADRALAMAREALARWKGEVRPEDVEHAREVIGWLESEAGG